MAGDERARFCPHCRQHVFNLSGMTRPEAEALIQQKQGNLCGRYYQRSDGTMLTRECTQGVRRKLWRGLALSAVLVITLMAVIFPLGQQGQDSAGRGRGRLRDQEPFRTIPEWFDPTPPPVLQGKICAPPDVRGR
jgi:hypothetical protein